MACGSRWDRRTNQNDVHHGALAASAGCAAQCLEELRYDSPSPGLGTVRRNVAAEGEEDRAQLGETNAVARQCHGPAALGTGSSGTDRYQTVSVQFSKVKYRSLGHPVGRGTSPHR